MIVPAPEPDPHDDEVDPRFLLANERTFLAWGRTALALVAAGLAVTQLLHRFDLPGGRELLGLPLILVGGLIAWLSHRRSNQIERALRQGLELPSQRLATLLTGTIVAAAGLSAILAVVGQPVRSAPKDPASGRPAAPQSPKAQPIQSPPGP